MLKSIILATVLTSTLGAATAFARPTAPVSSAPNHIRPMMRWASLGELRVGGRRDASLEVDRRVGPLSKLRLIVKAGELGTKTLKVTFANGSTFVTRVSGDFAMVDLPGEARHVTAIELEGSRFRRGGRAMVEILGERAARAPHYAYYR